ncbi:MAG: hypothetical protein GXY53_02660 [Desulfobulbus sp.]|nr:hypothetical protein [Desulfobulbus sp.]
MIESITAKGVKGRTATNHIVHATGIVESLRPGDLARVLVEHAGNHSLKGHIFENTN